MRAGPQLGVAKAARAPPCTLPILGQRFYFYNAELYISMNSSLAVSRKVFRLVCNELHYCCFGFAGNCDFLDGCVDFGVGEEC